MRITVSGNMFFFFLKYGESCGEILMHEKIYWNDIEGRSLLRKLEISKIEENLGKNVR